MKTSITLGRLRMSRQQLMIGGGLLLLLVVVACLPNDKSAIEAAVKENLRDPGSAQFGDLVLSESGQRACIQYNGKNAFGGYGDESTAELVKRDGVWTILTMEGGSSCNPTGFAIQDAREAAGKEAERRFLMLIGEAADPAPRSPVSNEAEPQPCTDMHDEFVAAMQDTAEYNLRRKLNEYSPDWHSHLKDSAASLKAMEKTISSGQCTV